MSHAAAERFMGDARTESILDWEDLAKIGDIGLGALARLVSMFRRDGAEEQFAATLPAEQPHDYAAEEFLEAA